jgi:Uma2 family endonuclease
MVTTTRNMTIKQLEREGAPEGRFELIDGELVEMSPSSTDASSIAALFITFVGMHVIPQKLGVMVGADGGFAVFSGQETVRVPDAAFVSTERLPLPDQRHGFWQLAPDIAIEVVSPSDRMRDVVAKALMWLEAGSRLVWVVHPSTRSITVYESGRDPWTLGEHDILTGGNVLPDFQMPVHEIFPV